MTFQYYFFVEQAFLSQVKQFIALPEANDDDEIEKTAIHVIALAAAIEALINSLVIKHHVSVDLVKTEILKKVEIILAGTGATLDKGAAPWQDIVSLVKARNWLMHYKDSAIGLLGSEGRWIQDDANKIPKIDPDKFLTKSNLRRLYAASLGAMNQLVLACQGDLGEYVYLETQEYQSLLAG